MRQQRVVVIFAVFLVGYGLLAAQLVRLQVVEHDMWARESARSTATFSTVPFERGWLMDRHGDPVARTEKVFDLVFEYRAWRRDSIAGSVLHAWMLLGADSSSVQESLELAQARLERLGGLRAVDVARLEPRKRRGDVLFYLGILFGDDIETAFLDRLRAGGDALDTALAELPGFERALVHASEQLQREQFSLPDLADLLGLSLEDLLGGMESTRKTAERRIERRLIEQLRAPRLAEAKRLAAEAVESAVQEARALGASVAARPEADTPGDSTDTSGVDEIEIVEPTEEDLAAYVDTRDGYAQYNSAQLAFEEQGRTLQSAVPYDTRTLVTLRGRDFPGFGLRPQVRRVYPSFGGREIAPLLVGSVGMAPEKLRIGDKTVNPLELADENLSDLMDLLAKTELSEAESQRIEELRLLVREIDYRPDEEVGRRGLERLFEAVLRGKRGWVASRRDEGGQVVERMEPQRGLNVTLSLDAQLQSAAEKLLDEIHAEPPEPHGASEHWNGAIVLLDPRDGDVLALATGPRPLRSEFRTRPGELGADPDTPLRHRGLRPGGLAGNLPPPGSLFKPITALAWRSRARARGELDLDPAHTCEGSLAAAGMKMGCLGYHGSIHLEQALARSCNVYFYELAATTELSDLYDYAHRFGLDRPTNLVEDNPRLVARGVPLDPTGLLEGVREETRKLEVVAPERATLIDRMSFAIGQRPLDDVTPLQVSVMTAALATGRLPQASLVRHVEGYPELGAPQFSDLDLDPRDLAEVQDAMIACVENTTGTAHLLTELYEQAPFDQLRGRIAAKTGTAEVGSKDHPDHAWVAGFFPREDPRLVFVVFLELVDLHGSESAVPVLKRLLSDPAVAAYVSADVLGLEVSR